MVAHTKNPSYGKGSHRHTPRIPAMGRATMVAHTENLRKGRNRRNFGVLRQFSLTESMSPMFSESPCPHPPKK